jgi:hypothetical protein
MATGSMAGDDVVLERTLARPGATRGMIAFGVLGVLALACAITNRAIGDEALPSGLAGTTPYFLIATAVFAVGTLITGLRAVSRFRVVRRGDTCLVQIADRRGPIELTLPAAWSAAGA